MRDVTQVLREKENQLERLGKEIKVLRVAAKILAGEDGGAALDVNSDNGKAGDAAADSDSPHKVRWP